MSSNSVATTVLDFTTWDVPAQTNKDVQSLPVNKATCVVQPLSTVTTADATILEAVRELAHFVAKGSNTM